MRDYEHIRRAEGRVESSPAYFWSLPFPAAAPPLAPYWAFRAVAYQALLASEPLDQGPRDILDLGAGNGWLANRLALLGHRLTAVDLLTNTWDGLGTLAHYRVPILGVQAEYDALPFAPAQFDIIVFNASFHYSVDYQQTLMEVLRCLRPIGLIVAAATAIYTNATSGKQMLAEQAAQFQRQYGTPSTSLKSQGFLTWALLNELAASQNVSVEAVKLSYGWRTTISRLVGRLQLRRELASFALLRFTRGPA